MIEMQNGTEFPNESLPRKLPTLGLVDISSSIYVCAMNKIRSKDWRDQLHARLVDSGWQRTFVDDDTDWWVDEHWTISSVRQNYGLVLILSFLIFPYHEGAEEPTTVWMVTAATQKPTDRNDDRGLIAEAHLQKGHFNENLKVMVETINRFRNSHE